MKKTLLWLMAGILLISIGASVYADLARPKSSPEKPIAWAGLTIEPDAKSYDARLQISETTLKELRAALTEPENRSNSISMTSSSSRTVFAGLSLFLAISLAGVWLARSGHTRGRKAATALLIVMAFGALAMLTHANAGPPPAYRWKPLTRNLTEGRATRGTVAVEIVKEGEGIKLILPIAPAKKASDE